VHCDREQQGLIYYATSGIQNLIKATIQFKALEALMKTGAC
ncbi:5795_t:CDS:2, partial [Dentiscutata erythropus]